MLCIEWDNEDEPIIVSGIQGDPNFSSLEVLLVPCNYLHTLYDYTGDSVHPECVGDLN